MGLVEVTMVEFWVPKKWVGALRLRVSANGFEELSWMDSQPLDLRFGDIYGGRPDSFCFLFPLWFFLCAL